VLQNKTIFQTINNWLELWKRNLNKLRKSRNLVKWPQSNTQIITLSITVEILELLFALTISSYSYHRYEDKNIIFVSWIHSLADFDLPSICCVDTSKW